MDTQQTFTKPEEKPKNPKRVAQGKKLAEASKAAKQRRRAMEGKNDECEKNDEHKENASYFTGISMITVLGTGACLFSTYIAYRQWQAEKPQSSTVVTPQGEKETTNEFKEKKVYNNLDKFSL